MNTSKQILMRQHGPPSPIVLSDTFSGSGSIAGRPPDTISNGNTWSMFAGVLAVVGGSLRGSSGTYRYGVINPGLADCIIESTGLSNNQSGWVGIFLRKSADGTQGYVLVTTNSATRLDLYLHNSVTNAFTLIRSFARPALVQNALYPIKIILQGAMMYLSYAGLDLGAQALNAAYNSNTITGVYEHSNAGTAIDLLYDLKVSNIVTNVLTPATITPPQNSPYVTAFTTTENIYGYGNIISSPYHASYPPGRPFSSSSLTDQWIGTSGVRWLGFCFHIPKVVTKLRWGAPGTVQQLSSGYLQWSDDGTTWTNVSAISRSNAITIDEFNIPYAGGHRYWRVTCDVIYSGPNAQCSHFELIGYQEI